MNYLEHRAKVNKWRSDGVNNDAPNGCALPVASPPSRPRMEGTEAYSCHIASAAMVFPGGESTNHLEQGRSPSRKAAMIQIKRVYDPANSSDGSRLLVERLWPRGIKKDSLKIDNWLKNVAPSSELRKWFSHDPKKWDAFRKRYETELRANPDVWQPIIEAENNGPVTLIYSSHDTAHNNAVALRDFL